ncbi:condensation domain-containing protein [Paenibacillus alvei]|uniref:Condensation domain-containing protein n=2 Tax=Paenibacillus alvei TaxID=44250 RepID=A0ABT4GZV6_PAEAL|nr:condensation domain-containing protein [Paenibacillus alvei]MCY9761937.1 condensation domain-containing protein [Paenibacillus alvei]MCY9768513.1 condensation domain-containing protein [Paenibacillus alvei]
MELNKQVQELGVQVTGDLLERLNKAYRTDFLDILLAALALTIRDWTREANTLISLISQERDGLFHAMDVSRTVGCFSSQFPVVLKAYDDLGDTIKHTKDMLRKIPNQGRFYGVFKYLSSEDFHDVTPEISFKYVGRSDQAARENGFEIINHGFNDHSSSYLASIHSLDMEAILIADQIMISISYRQDEF